MAPALRSNWLPKLAKAVGWAPQRLRNLLNREGYKFPYTSELRALKILTEKRVPFPKYKPTEDGVGFNPKAKVEPAKSAAPAEQIAEPNAGAAPSTLTEPESKLVRAWDRRLPARLAKITRYGNTSQGRNWVRYTLKARGYSDPKFRDEAQALAIFQKMGMPLDGFEYENSPGTPGGPLFAPPAATIEELRQQYLGLIERMTTLMDEASEKDAQIAKLEKKIATLRTMLLQCEHQIKLAWMNNAIPGILKPMEYAISALNEVR